jgi:hypothetical protein
MTQVKLGHALVMLGSRESGTARLEEAVAAQSQNLLQVAPEFYRQRKGFGLSQILSSGFGPGNVPRGRPVEPHHAFAAQANDAASDQNIGVGLLEQAPRFLFGFFLL